MYNSPNAYDDSAEYDKIFLIKDCLQIETYVIGYKSQGESILFFILVDDIICFSGAVDCFCLCNDNYTEKILIDKGDVTLDFLCWTHPDLDHSRGMDHLVDNFTDKNTKIWIPEDVDLRKATCGPSLKKIFKLLKNKVMVDRYNVHSVSDNKDLMFYKSYCFKKEAESFPLKIYSYAPNSSVIRLSNYKENNKSNLYSVFWKYL